MPYDNQNLVSKTTKAETALDVAAFVGSAVPWIGGPVSNVLSGRSRGHKFERIREVLEGLSSDLSDFKSTISEEYVKTEDFEDLLEQTLKRAADERNEEKRKIYRAFLTNAIKSPGELYDEQIRFLRTFEELQIEHLLVVRALSQPPEPDPGMMGSPNQTLRKRLPELNEERISDVISQLNDMRITKLTSLKTMMTGHGAADLRHSITPYGQLLLKYIMKA